MQKYIVDNTYTFSEPFSKFLIRCILNKPFTIRSSHWESVLNDFSELFARYAWHVEIIHNFLNFWKLKICSVHNILNIRDNFITVKKNQWLCALCTSAYVSALYWGWKALYSPGTEKIKSQGLSSSTSWLFLDSALLFIYCEQ